MTGMCSARREREAALPLSSVARPRLRGARRASRARPRLSSVASTPRAREKKCACAARRRGAATTRRSRSRPYPKRLPRCVARPRSRATREYFPLCVPRDTHDTKTRKNPARHDSERRHIIGQTDESLAPSRERRPAKRRSRGRVSTHTHANTPMTDLHPDPNRTPSVSSSGNVKADAARNSLVPARR